MNDRFKFRMWHEKQSEMIELGICPQCCKCSPHKPVNLEECNIMQCTGLQDKNGKLIYEGDVVRFYDDTICIIKWDNESGMFCTLDTEGQAMIGVPEYYEVLGNIYENPELVKEIKETRKNKEEKNNG